MPRPGRDTAHLVTNVCVGVILTGVVFLCQPWSLTLYQSGFQVLLIGTVGYIVASHLE